MNIKTISDFRKAVRQGPYAWPGGYPIYFLTIDGAALSFEAVKTERRNILHAICDNDDDSGWRVFASEINCEDEDLYCDHTGSKIEAAYESS